MITLDKLTPGFYDAKAAEHASLFAAQAAIAIQNARLFEETRRHVAEMDVLLKAGQQIAATLDLDTMLHTIARHAVQLVGALCGWLLLVSVEDKVVFRRAAHGIDEKKLEILDYGFALQGLEGWVIRERTPALSHALVNDERVTDRARRWASGLQLGSAIAVPLLVKEQVVGVLTVAKTPGDQPLTQHATDLLTVMASQAAIALENAELFAERERNIAELSIMYQTSRSLSASLDLDAIVDMVYNQVSQVMDATNFYIALYDPETDRVSFPLAVEHGTRREWPSRQGGQGLTEFILTNKRPLLLPNRVRQRIMELGLEPIGTEAYSWLGVPMLAGDKVLGVICVQSYDRENVYDQDHLSLLSTLAAQAAVAVRNAQLFQQVQALAAEMEQRVEERTEDLVKAVSDLMLERDRVQTLYRITTELAASLDIDRVLNRALSLVCEAVGAPQGSILLMDSHTEYLVHRSALRRQEPLPRDGVRTRYREGVGLAGWVLETQESVIVPDVSEDPRWIQNDGDDAQSKAALAVPLVLGDTPQGVLLLFHPRADYFTKDHLQLVMTIGYQLASAINNADLYTLVQESAERLGRLARANQAEAAQSQAILEAIADGVMVTDAQGEVILFNAAAGRILGTPRDAVLGRNIEDMSGLYGAEGASWVALTEGWQTGRADETAFIAEQLQLEGRVVSVHLAPVFIETEFLGTVSVFRDITHDVEVAQMKSEFVSTVSHELRTPMTSIKGFVDLLLLGAAGDVSERQKHFLNIIKTNVDRLATLVGDLLDLSRIETGRLRLKLERIDFSDVVKVVVDSLRAKIESKKLETIVDLPDYLPMVMGDRDRLIQILTNLVANAYQYTPPGGQIQIAVTPNDDSIQVTVADNGIGISDEDQTKIFDRFFRADHPIVRETGGTGLGLPIVKNLIELHGGDLWLRSELGEGTQFSFTLPFKTPEPQDTDGEKGPTGPNGSEGVTLFADQESAVVNG
jgi:PAS domain S-box-containing protein